MVLARLGRRRAAILHKQSIELPSDIAGLTWIGFQERLDEVQARLFTELRQAGFEPDPAEQPSWLGEAGWFDGRRRLQTLVSWLALEPGSL
jgi:hypothetical protein